MTADYDAGFAAGRASRDAEFEGLQRVADYWHFRANNPGVKTVSQKTVDSIIAGMEINEEWRRKRDALDAVEQEMFAEARVLISQGLSDVEVAVKVGLFVPTVENIRAGVL